MAETTFGNEGASFGDQEMKPTVKTRGRKLGGGGSSTKGSQAKKQPQRGLGVAQLEKLRLQDRWKKMTDFDQVLPLSNSIQHQQNQFQFQFPLLETQSCSFVPVPHSSRFSDPFVNYGAAKNNLSQSSSSMVFNNPQRFGNGGFNVGGGGGDGSGFRSVPLMKKAQQHCVSDQCEICLTKQRFINGGNLGLDHGGRTTHYPETKPFNGCDLLQYPERKPVIINGGSCDQFPYLEGKPFHGCDLFLGLDLGRSSNCPVNGGARGNDEEVEVVAVHRMGMKSGSGRSSVLMEYEFFPRQANNSSSSSRSRNSFINVKKEGGSSSFAQVEEAAAAGSSSVKGSDDQISAAAANNNTHDHMLDLSLKLSC